MGTSRDLFGPDLPTGLHYREDFLTEDEEQRLIDEIAEVKFSAFALRGVVARRRVAFFGASYDEGPAAPLPPFLLRWRERLSRWAGISAETFAMALINEYRPGTPIGWHRDSPQYDLVAGISLRSDCRMRFRPYRSPAAPPSRQPRIATHEVVLQRRSAYLMTGESRQAYEHQIPPVKALRYSVTFRTLRASRHRRP